jgi:SAM-dependent methyltransferase
MTTTTTAGSLYDHPVWYEMVFGSDWSAEFHFLRSCFKKFVRGKTNSVFEPACGTGRILFRLAKAGYRVSGLDLNAAAVEFCNRRLVKHGFGASTLVADMCSFTLPKPVDAAFNMINSFRHLTTERQARAHLRAMAGAVREGGIYALGLHLTPTEGEACDEESWSCRRGHLAATSHLKTFGLDLEERLERCRMEVNVYMPTKSMQIVDELRFRTYTADQMAATIAAVPQWKIAGTFDFHYDTDWPIRIGPATQDVVYVLRRTAEPLEKP